MATHANSTSAFVEKLLAPLPADVEQVDTPEYRQRIRRDMMMIWSKGMDDVKVAIAHHTITSSALRGSKECGRGPKSTTNWAAVAAVGAAMAAQCLIPAPSEAAVAWKRRAIKSTFIRDTKEAEAAIERDEQRLSRLA